MDRATLERFEETYLKGKRWLWSCDLGWIGVEEVAALMPRTLIADHTLPDTIGSAARRQGIAMVEPIFTALSVLTTSTTDKEPIRPEDLTPTTPWRPLSPS